MTPPNPPIGIGTRLYRIGSAHPYTIVGEREGVPGWIAQSDGLPPHTFSFSKQLPGDKVYVSDDGVRHSAYDDWTMDETEWLKSEEVRRAQPVREWVEPPPPVLEYDPTPDLERRAKLLADLAALLQPTDA